MNNNYFNFLREKLGLFHYGESMKHAKSSIVCGLFELTYFFLAKGFVDLLEDLNNSHRSK